MVNIVNSVVSIRVVVEEKLCVAALCSIEAT
jgi:hypothetical protein